MLDFPDLSPGVLRAVTRGSVGYQEVGMRTLFARRRGGKTQFRKNQIRMFEALEPRVLLTTMVGGDVFEFIDGQGQTVHIAVSGDTTAVVLGVDQVTGG